VCVCVCVCVCVRDMALARGLGHHISKKKTIAIASKEENYSFQDTCIDLADFFLKKICDKILRFRIPSSPLRSRWPQLVLSKCHTVRLCKSDNGKWSRRERERETERERSGGGGGGGREGYCYEYRTSLCLSTRHPSSIPASSSRLLRPCLKRVLVTPPQSQLSRCLACAPKFDM